MIERLFGGRRRHLARCSAPGCTRRATHLALIGIKVLALCCEPCARLAEVTQDVEVRAIPQPKRPVND